MALFDELEELGELMADNLTEQGVNADASDGLTSLADKILAIEGSGGFEKITTQLSFNIEEQASYTIGDTVQVTGQLIASDIDVVGKIHIVGAEISFTHAGVVVGTATTGANGSFTSTITFQKSGDLIIHAAYAGTTHLSNANNTQTYQNKTVQKKSISLPQNLSDIWQPQQDTLIFNIGSEYEGAPIGLLINNTRRQTATVNSNGVIELNISQELGSGTYSAQLQVQENDVYEHSSITSNTFNYSIGVNIYPNPKLEITSTKDILSYADNESATLTAKIKSDAAEISSVNIPLTYKEDPVLTATKSGITITELNDLYLCESIDTNGYIIFDMDADQTETSFTINNVTANSADSSAKCALVQYYQNGTVTYDWELLDTNDFGDGDYIIRIKDGNIDVYKDGIHVENQSLREGYKLGFGIYEYSFDISDINIERIINNGLSTGIYTSRGVGDVGITAKYGSLVTEIFGVQDCVDVISGETDQSSKFGSSIGLRNSGTSSISYDSTNKQYIVNVTKTNSESFIPINSATGLDDVIIEFDGYLPTINSFLALCFYKENNNWGRLGTKYVGSSAYEYGGNTNGTYAEADISGSTPPTNTWLHHKFTITNDTIHRQVYNGETLIYEDTRTYTGFFTSTTKYGFTALWGTDWKGYYKNIKIKPL